MPEASVISGKYIQQVGLLALAYLVTGKLGLLLAIPPGYATAVWPASGIALAALLLYGCKIWPGVLLGSFLVNIFTSLDASTSESLIRSMVLASSVGTGAALQALLGAWLIRRYINVEDGLVTTRSVIAFLGLGGPVSCLVSPIWGVTTLWLAGLINPDQYPYSLATWWVGDAIGVLLFLPLVYVWLGHPVEAWRWRRYKLSLPLGTCILIVIGLFMFTSWLEQRRIEAEFEQRALIVSDSLDKQLANYIEVLHSLESLIQTRSHVDRFTFKTFVRRSLARNSGIQAVSWNPVIGAEDRARFEVMMQAQGYTGFYIRERDEQGKLTPAGAYAQHVVVQYIEPYETNRNAHGFDVYSDAVRRLTLDRASDAGVAMVTSRITLVQESGTQAGLLVFLPVFDSATNVDIDAPQRSQLMGFAVGVLRAGDMLTNALNGLNVKHINVQLSDLTAASDKRHLAAASLDGGGLAQTVSPFEANDALHWSKRYHFAGRNWEILVQPTSSYMTESRSWSAWYVLAGGLTLTGMLGIFLLSLTGRSIIEKRQVQALAQANTSLNREILQRKQAEQQLKEANEHLEQLATIDPLTNAWNRRRMEQFGFACDAERRRYGDPYSAILIDADHFKTVNDYYGHDVGDVVLKKLADTLSAELRETDRFARWGGEEFVILAKRTPLEQAAELGERLCQVVRETPIDTVGQITISVGVASSESASDYTDVINRADKAMYQAKTSGRDRVCVLRPDKIAKRGNAD